jgi:RNase H-fold protein (predicted Holliday junction resolvase)
MSGLTDEFIKNILLNKLDIDVIKVDERMTSSVVTKSNKERIDDISALEILETYLSNV